MKSNLIRVPTLGMSREKWLEVRRGAIGGSDAAAIIGLNQYSSPYSVWADKTGRLPEKPDNEAMRLGRDLEEYVASRWREETGKKTKRVNAILYSKKIPFAHANVDRWVSGENAGLECKTTSIMNLKKFKGGEYPENYYVQCVHYMAVTGADRWYLAVLVLGKGFYHFTIERDEEEIAALMQQEESFWQHVETDTPPAVDGAPATSDTLKTIYSGASGESIELFGRDELFRRYEELTSQKSEIDAEIEKIKQQLMADLREAESATCGAWSVSWKKQTRKTFDVEAFKKQNPSVKTDPYYKFSVNRVMRISKKSEKSEV